MSLVRIRRKRGLVRIGEKHYSGGMGHIYLSVHTRSEMHLDDYNGGRVQEWTGWMVVLTVEARGDDLALSYRRERETVFANWVIRS